MGVCVCALGRPRHPHAGQPYPQADFLWAAGYGETSTMRAGQKVQRRHQESHEMVRNQRGGPVQRLTQSHLLAYLVSQRSLRTRVSQLSSIDEQSGSSAHNHSTILVPGRAAAAPRSATPELDSTLHT